MIEHLRQREKALEQFGWTGREAEWIALVCLHSGVFTRAQFCHYFDTDRKRALRFVKASVARRQAVESETLVFSGGGQAVPDIQQADLPGTGGRAYPPPAKGAPRCYDAAAALARFRSGTSGDALASHRAGEGRVF